MTVVPSLLFYAIGVLMQQDIFNESSQLSALWWISYITIRNKCGACRLFSVQRSDLIE